MDGILFHTGDLPARSYPGDAGIDLVTSEDTLVHANSHGMVPSNNAIQIPEGTFGWITARSSTIGRYGFLVISGIIDEGYTGQLFAAVWNLTNADVAVPAGSRLAQIILIPNATRMFSPQKVNRLDNTARGTNGFGSPGH